MADNTLIDPDTGRKCYLDVADPIPAGKSLTFLLSLHGGGSVGHWQREYFPAYDYKDKYGLVIATPSAATKKPMSHWASKADDEYLHKVVNQVFERYGEHIRSFWLVGHSQGSITSNRLLQDPFFSSRVDGWLSLSGGRIGQAELSESFFAPFGNKRPKLPVENKNGPSLSRTLMPPAEISFIFATGEHEIKSLPETSPWAEKLQCSARERLPDVVDTEPGKIYDTLRDGKSSKGWGLRPQPGTAEIYQYPNAKDGQIVADVVRLDKGHTEGLEPWVTETLVQMMVLAPAVVSGSSANNAG